eukprot:1113212-Prorocentrum_minimum.AAC.1
MRTTPEDLSHAGRVTPHAGGFTPHTPPPLLCRLCTGLGLVRGTRASHTELAPGNPGCSQRW